MRKWVSAALLGAGLLAAGSANAQGWGVYVGRDNRPYGGNDDDDRLARDICTGDRAHALEDRLDHEVNEDEIDEREASRIHGAIDRLEDKRRHECKEGDDRAIDAIAYRYDRIAQWIDSEAHDRRW